MNHTAYLITCVAVFLAAYLVNIFYITVLYHRGLTHGAVKLSPGTLTWLKYTGNWVTGLDPKGWALMHRMHHLYSDTPMDPHSPSHHNIFAIMLVQLKSYNGYLVKLLKKSEAETKAMKDVPFDVSWLNKHGLWALPYLVHAGVALALGLIGGWWLLGAAYWLGMMSHPVQGWAVNALAHKYGYRNFSTPDDSKNNTPVAWFVFGEGYQNNHHQSPRSAKFSVKASEIDLGYALCVIAERFGMVEIVPVPPEALPGRASEAA